MPRYTAITHWARRESETARDFLERRYSRAHWWQFDGGAECLASASPHSVRPPFSDPAAIDPEEAFIASLSSCHLLWFLSLAADAGFVVEDYRDDAEGLLSTGVDGRLAMTRVTLRPKVAFDAERAPSPEQLRQLHDDAHEQCFIAASVKTEVVIEL